MDRLDKCKNGSEKPEKELPKWPKVFCHPKGGGGRIGGRLTISRNLIKPWCDVRCSTMNSRRERQRPQPLVIECHQAIRPKKAQRLPCRVKSSRKFPEIASRSRPTDHLPSGCYSWRGRPFQIWILFQTQRLDVRRQHTSDLLIVSLSTVFRKFRLRKYKRLRSSMTHHK